jgi:hypothetical protein
MRVILLGFAMDTFLNWRPSSVVLFFFSVKLPHCGRHNWCRSGRHPLAVMADVGTSNILSRDWSEALPPSRGRLGHEIRALREIESIWEFGMRHYLEAQPTNLAGRDLNPAVEGI